MISLLLASASIPYAFSNDSYLLSANLLMLAPQLQLAELLARFEKSLVEVGGHPQIFHICNQNEV